MAKQSGLGDNLYVGGYDLSGDINSLRRVGGGPIARDITGIDKFAFERLGGKRDGAIELVAYFNPTPNRSHDRLNNLPTADTIVSYFRGTSLGGHAANLVAKQINYDGNRDDDGDLVFSVEAQANGYGLEWGQSLTAGKRTDAAPTNGSGVDFGASSAFGLQAYLHVFAFTGTSATIKLQESSDNAGADPYADVTGGAFATVTGVTSERIATSPSQTIERWLRVVTTGTFSNLIFAVVAVKNPVATVF